MQVVRVTVRLVTAIRLMVTRAHARRQSDDEKHSKSLSLALSLPPSLYLSAFSISIYLSPSLPLPLSLALSPSLPLPVSLSPSPSGHAACMSSDVMSSACK
jgi:hypothetical protein